MHRRCFDAETIHGEADGEKGTDQQHPGDGTSAAQCVSNPFWLNEIYNMVKQVRTE